MCVCVCVYVCVCVDESVFMCVYVCVCVCVRECVCMHVFVLVMQRIHTICVNSRYVYTKVQMQKFSRIFCDGQPMYQHILHTPCIRQCPPEFVCQIMTTHLKHTRPYYQRGPKQRNRPNAKHNA